MTLALSYVRSWDDYQTFVEGNGRPHKKSISRKLIAIAVAAAMVVAIVSYVTVFAPRSQGPFYQPVTSANEAQYASINTQNAAQYVHDVITACTPSSTSASTGGTYNAATGACYKFAVKDYHAGQTAANINLLNEGFNASCLIGCHGITYTVDPTIITNQGHGFEDCKVFSPSSGLTDTCTAANFASIMGWSIGHTPTVNATDTWAGGHHSCSTTTPETGFILITDANGLADTAGTTSDGGNGATTTVTITHSFSITGTYTGINVACLNTALHGGTNPLIYAESTFGPDSFASGDSLSGTWTISRT